MAGKISYADKWTDKIFCLHLHFRLSQQMGAELDRLQNVRMLLPTCDSYFLSPKNMKLGKYWNICFNNISYLLTDQAFKSGK